MSRRTPARRRPARTVLVVDDEPFFLRSVADALRPLRDEFEVLTAGGGREAIQVLTERPIDLLITDLNMPEVDGLTVLSELISRRPGVPAIVMTAYGAPEIEENARSIGAVGYLEKPLELSTLVARIRETLAERQRDHIAGVTLFGFLQLLQLERKSCTLDVASGERLGSLYFRGGQLVHAVSGDLVGEPAVIAIGRWPDPDIEIDHVCQSDRVTVHASLQELLLEAARLEDEARRDRELEGEGEVQGELGSLDAAEAGAGDAIATATAWWQAMAAGVPEPEDLVVIAVDVRGGGRAVLAGPAEVPSEVDFAALSAQAAAIAGAGSGTLEVVTQALGLFWVFACAEGAGLLLLRSLEEPKDVALFRRQTAWIGRSLAEN
jgi:CheY-like chemotaxis protein